MQNNVEFEEEIETIFEKFWEELNNVPISNELHLIVVDKWKTQLISKNNKNIKLCEISVKYDTYNANLILLGKDSEIVDYYICASDIIHIKNVYIYHYKDVIQIFPRKNSTLKIIRVEPDKDLVDIQEDVLEITLDVRTQDIVTILFEKFRDRFIEIQHLQNWNECFVHKPVEDTFDEFYEDEIHNILETELDKIEIKCKNMNNGFCSMNVHNIMVKMGAKESRNYKRGLFEKYVEYLCCWNDIPEKKEDCNILKNFLRKKYNLDWVLEAKIDKTEWDTVIRVFTQTEKLTIRQKQTKAIVNYLALDGLSGVFNLDNLRTDTLILKYEGCNLNIYYQKYPIFEEGDCFQYLQQYVPFHLPQISLSLKEVIKYSDNNNIFDSYTTLNILDIGSGPATVPLALCRLKKDELKNRKFRITTIEASEGFNKMIERFREAKPEYIEIINNLNHISIQSHYCWS